MRWDLAVIAVFSAIAGCVAVPSVEPDVERARQIADQRGVLDPRPYEAITHLSFVPGNAIELLRNGTATYSAMTALIENARHRVDIESYTFEGDEAVKFADLLLAKSAQGLDVNLIYDAWGSDHTVTALFRRLTNGGVQVLEYNPIVPTDVLRLNSRDHRKLLVVDAEAVILGGINISQVYDNRRIRGVHIGDPDKLPWRDTDVQIVGPVAAQFERMFMATWHGHGGQTIPDPPPTPVRTRGTTTVMALGGDPDKDHPNIYQSLLVAIALARSTIHLTTGFFAPTPELDSALERAARRGVEIGIVVSTHSTSRTTLEAGRADYASLMQAGAHIYERRDDVVVHAKTAVVDGVWSTVGSANLDWRSVIFNDESDALIFGPEFGKQMEAMFSKDVSESRVIDPNVWAQRSLRERIEEWGAHIVEFLL